MKRTRRQSSADGELAQLVSRDAVAADDGAKSPDHKRTRTEQSDHSGEVEANAQLPVVEADVRGIMTALRAKPEWTRKVADPTIVAKWRAEALAQGASASSVAEALARLLRESVVGEEVTTGAALGRTLSVPSEAERDEMLDHDDRDFWLEESDEVEGKPRDDVCWRDGLVPEELRASLEAKLDALAAAPNKDFHPGSDNKVQDLVHPSLYPYIRGLSYEPAAAATAAVAPPKRQVTDLWVAKRMPSDDDDDGEGAADDDDDASSEEGGEEQEEFDYEDMGGDADEEKKYLKKEKTLEQVESIYQWLPAEFDVAADGAVSIESYINNLDRTRHAALYDDIAATFRLFVPLFENVLSGRPLSGKRLQVVVKAANYILQPGESHEGSWHVEGMKHEHIVASGIYYYHTTPNLADSCLAFRLKRHNDLEERGGTQGYNFNQNLGKADTPMGRCLVFGNHLQHKVRDMKNKSTDQVGLRKILCFFLIDPDHRVKSSADIPPQQWDETKKGVAHALIEATVRHKVSLPSEIIHHILKLAQWGFTWEEAKAHREKLMWERKFYVTATNEIWERNFSFCEH